MTPPPQSGSAKTCLSAWPTAVPVLLLTACHLAAGVMAPVVLTPSAVAPIAPEAGGADTVTDLPLETSTVPPNQVEIVPLALPTPSPTADLLPTPDADALHRKVRLPVLMYHYIEPWTADLSLVERGLTVKPEDFAEQMAYLHDHGYVTVSLYDLVDALTLGRSLPPKAIVLTFDGGHRSLLQYAVPVMQQYGYTGTIFVITKGMEQGETLYLTWQQAKALYNQGWKIEPHTRTHQQLSGRDAGFQVYELQGSMQDVANHIGVTPRFIAYPSGKYDALTLHLVRALGFWGGLTVRVGRWHSLSSIYTLPRVRINGTGTFEDFKIAVEGDLQH